MINSIIYNYLGVTPQVN